MSAAAARSGSKADGFAVASLVTVGSSVAAGEAGMTEQAMAAEATTVATVATGAEQRMTTVERKGLAQGWQVVRGGGRRNAVRDGLREGSSGRTVTLPRVWAVAAPAEAPVAVPALPVLPEVAFYRKYTEALLGEYAKAKLAAGRAPSPMAREIVRGHASHTRVSFFDDTMHFCLDVERCLEVMDRTDAKLLRRVAIQGYSHEEAAMSMGMSVMSGHRRYGRALDAMTKLLIERGILDLSKLVKGCDLQVADSEANRDRQIWYGNYRGLVL